MGGVTLTLRRTTPADLPALFGWIGSEAELVQWSGPAFTWPLSLAQLRASLDDAADEGRLVWTAETGGAPIGHAAVVRTDEARVGRLGRVLVAPDRRGQGHGAALVVAAVSEGFAATGVDVMTLGVYEHNSVARRIYEALGFVPTGSSKLVAVGDETWCSVELACHRERFAARRVWPGSGSA